MRGSFTKKSVRTQTLGEKLRNFRSEKRISLLEVSRSTRIQFKYLECLEEGNYGELPADVYVKGFLRGYAEFFGVDERILIRQYEKEKGIKINLEKANGTRVEKKEPINISPFLITPKIIAIAAGALLVFGGLFYLYREIGAFANKPTLVILSPNQNAVESSNSVVVSGATDKDAKVFINNQPVLVSDEGKFNENLALQFGTNAINIKSVNRFDRVTTENLLIQSTYQQAPINDAPENTQIEIVPENNKILLEVRVDPGPVWVSVEADDNLVFSGTMLVGAIQSFSADEKISINSGKANATFIKFNGKDIGALGEKAVAVRGVAFTKDTKY
ncbi:MAG: hypothetical protein COX30_03440 [Candidatus Moranbacteria bacterium CG23_combo_of_CG06-09_8_20_14_all_39_10]|nr:MAG: hypothetical protein COX30_03440 [Candidatus Moranbacteria bacterium CG23_combo_of_CG06-09_8_20_14_all_39_10]